MANVGSTVGVKSIQEAFSGLVQPGDIVGKVGTSGENHPDRTVDGVFQSAGHDYQYDAHLQMWIKKNNMSILKEIP